MSEPVLPSDFARFVKVEEVIASERYVFWVEKSSKSDLSGYQKRIFRHDLQNNVTGPFTSGTFQDFTPKLSYDESCLAFISTRNGYPQLFIQSQTGGEAILVSLPHLKLRSFAWHPKSDKLAYVAYMDTELEEIITSENFDPSQLDDIKERLRLSREDPRTVKNLIYRTGTAFIEDWLHSQIFVYDLNTEETIRISSLDFNYQGIDWLDDIHVVSFTKFDKPADISDWLDIVKLSCDHENIGERLSRTFHPYIFDKLLSVNQFDRSMVLVQTYLESFTEGLRYQKLKWGLISGGETLIINEHLDRSVADIDWISPSEAITSVHHEGYTELRKYNHQLGSFEQFYQPDFSTESFSAISDTSIFATGTSPQHPSAVWKYDGQDFSLFHDPNQSWLSGKKLISPEVFWLENDDGVKFQGWYFDADTSSHNPLILSIHGGPHIMWNNAGTMWLEWQSQLSAGYSILAMNPVGSDGYGEEFLRVIVGNWGKKDARDILQTLDHLIATKNVDSSRLYITGGSYAGLQTVNLIGLTNRFSAACSQRGVYNLLTLDAGGDLARFGEIEYSGDIEIDVMRYWNDSPISKVSQIKTPLLLIHSETDYRVPIHQAEQLFMELRRRGNEVEFVRYPGEGHELSRNGMPRRLIDRLERMISWFNNH